MSLASSSYLNDMLFQLRSLVLKFNILRVLDTNDNSVDALRDASAIDILVLNSDLPKATGKLAINIMSAAVHDALRCPTLALAANVPYKATMLLLATIVGRCVCAK